MPTSTIQTKGTSETLWEQDLEKEMETEAQLGGRRNEVNEEDKELRVF